MPDLRVSFPKPCDETWEAMTPTGCDRVCARCDHVVHDLAEYTLDEAEALLRGNPGSCVRGRIAADSAVALKPGRGGKKRRMVVAAAAMAGLLTTATPALARQERSGGVISGTVEAGYRVRVVATAADGRTYRARADRNGRYRIRHLPAGTYRISVEASCDEYKTVENVVVADTETSAPAVQSESQCIVIGLLRIEDDQGRS